MKWTLPKKINFPQNGFLVIIIIGWQCAPYMIRLPSNCIKKDNQPQSRIWLAYQMARCIDFVWFLAAIIDRGWKRSSTHTTHLNCRFEIVGAHTQTHWGWVHAIVSLARSPVKHFDKKLAYQLVTDGLEYYTYHPFDLISNEVRFELIACWVSFTMFISQY